MKPEPSDIELRVMCDDIGATFPDDWQTAAVDGTAALIMTRCKSLSEQPTSNLITAQNNLSKWYGKLEEFEKEQHFNAFDFIIAKLEAVLKNRTTLADL